MWIALIVIAGLVGLVALMALVGSMLPREHVAARHAVIAKSRAEVWRVLTDLDAYPAWRRELKKLERLSTTRFREHSSDGAITFSIEVDDAPMRRVTRIADENLPFGGRWIYELEVEGEGTRLTITEDGFVKNPVFRLIRKTLMSEAGTLERFISDLANHLGVTAKPEPTEPSA
jgi:hypothetical protein